MQEGGGKSPRASIHRLRIYTWAGNPETTLGTLVNPPGRGGGARRAVVSAEAKIVP